MGAKRERNKRVPEMMSRVVMMRIRRQAAIVPTGIDHGPAAADSTIRADIVPREAMCLERVGSLELANAVSSAMPRDAVGSRLDALNGSSRPVRGSRIVVLGLGCGADAGEARERTARAVILEHLALEASPDCDDLHGPALRLDESGCLESVALTEQRLAWADRVLVHTAHSDHD